MNVKVNIVLSSITSDDEGEQRARSRQRAGRGTRALNFGQGADLGQSGQAKSPQKRKHCGTRGTQSPQRALHALPAPEPSPHQIAAAPWSALLSQRRLGTPPGLHSSPPPAPSAQGSAPVGALRGSFPRDLGTREGRRRGRGFRERDPRRLRALRAARAPPHAPRGCSLTAPKPANHGPPFSVRPVQSQPPCQSGSGPANLSPLSGGSTPQTGPAPATAALGAGGAVSSLPRQALLRTGRAAGSFQFRSWSGSGSGPGKRAGGGEQADAATAMAAAGAALEGTAGSHGAERGGNGRAGIGGAGRRCLGL
ncbi:uncharacterized protein LOC141730397 [Zonotrichia albicollis]|uniref:uncharacterized protein LOC141730397 n=1 Tax=Zonotrichia albicollis TaxID=44394 RepID=UPI003D80BDB8